MPSRGGESRPSTDRQKMCSWPRTDQAGAPDLQSATTAPVGRCGSPNARRAAAHTWGAWMRKRVLIAGAGIGGVTGALSLMKAGHDVTVFEQADRLIEVGAGIQLSANAMHVLNSFGLED